MQINLTPDYSLLAIMVIFILNYLIVSKFFLRPINRRDRSARERSALRERGLRTVDGALQRSDRRRWKRSFTPRATRPPTCATSFRREAAAYRASIVEKTHTDAGGIVSEADEKLKGDVAAARAKIVTESESLARLAAERILGRPV